jgi:hypothetical protein
MNSPVRGQRCSARLSKLSGISDLQECKLVRRFMVGAWYGKQLHGLLDSCHVCPFRRNITRSNKSIYVFWLRYINHSLLKLKILEHRTIRMPPIAKTRVRPQRSDFTFIICVPRFAACRRPHRTLQIGLQIVAERGLRRLRNFTYFIFVIYHSSEQLNHVINLTFYHKNYGIVTETLHSLVRLLSPKYWQNRYLLCQDR